METQAVRERIASIVNQNFESEPEYFLVDIHLSGTRVTVFIEGDKGITIGKCAKISRLIEKYLDEELILGEKYTLEVSSPGIGNPLKLFRQYKRYIGKEVKVIKADGVEVEGFLKSTNDTSIEIEQIIMEKKKEIDRKLFEIQFNDIKSTTLILNF